MSSAPKAGATTSIVPSTSASKIDGILSSFLPYFDRLCKKVGLLPSNSDSSDASSSSSLGSAARVGNDDSKISQMKSSPASVFSAVRSNTSSFSFTDYTPPKLTADDLIKREVRTDTTSFLPPSPDKTYPLASIQMNTLLAMLLSNPTTVRFNPTLWEAFLTVAALIISDPFGVPSLPLMISGWVFILDIILQALPKRSQDGKLPGRADFTAFIAFIAHSLKVLSTIFSNEAKKVNIKRLLTLPLETRNALGSALISIVCMIVDQDGFLETRKWRLAKVFDDTYVTMQDLVLESVKVLTVLTDEHSGFTKLLDFDALVPVTTTIIVNENILQAPAMALLRNVSVLPLPLASIKPVAEACTSFKELTVDSLSIITSIALHVESLTKLLTDTYLASCVFTKLIEVLEDTDAGIRRSLALDAVSNFIALEFSFANEHGLVRLEMLTSLSFALSMTVADPSVYPHVLIPALSAAKAARIMLNSQGYAAASIMLSSPEFMCGLTTLIGRVPEDDGATVAQAKGVIGTIVSLTMKGLRYEMKEDKWTGSKKVMGIRTMLKKAAHSTANASPSRSSVRALTANKKTFEM